MKQTKKNWQITNKIKEKSKCKCKWKEKVLGNLLLTFTLFQLIQIMMMRIIITSIIVINYCYWLTTFCVSMEKEMFVLTWFKWLCAESFRTHRLIYFIVHNYKLMISATCLVYTFINKMFMLLYAITKYYLHKVIYYKCLTWFSKKIISD